MNKFIFILCVLSLSAFAAQTDTSTPDTATPAVVSEDKNASGFKARESHWLANFGFEGMKYQTPFSFTGEKKNFKPSSQEVWGGRLGMGGEIYLGKGLMTTSKVEGYFLGTLFSKAKSANPTYDIQYAKTKNISQVLGLDLSQSLSFLFDMKTKNPFLEQWSYLTWEPFIEAGIGIGQAFNKVDYVYDTSSGGGAAGTSVAPNEAYRAKVMDSFISKRVSAGLNLISNSGYFLQLKVTTATYDVTNRKQESLTLTNGSTTYVPNKTHSNNVNLDAITIYTLGGGYKF
jgi:hypothetical protein